MRNRHVVPLLTRYVHGQLSPVKRALVINHVRACAACRMALAREERLANDLRREMPALGQPQPAQLAQVWAGVWQEIGTPPTRPRTHSGGSAWLPGLGVALTMLLVLMVALPLMAREVRAEAAPLQPRPELVVSTSTPGITVKATTRTGQVPQATVAYVSLVGASPAPMPEATVSPDAVAFRR